MSLVRCLPAWFHAVADHAVAVTLIAVAIAVGGSHSPRRALPYAARHAG